MKKYLLFLLAAFCISTSSKAASGDTTWVQAANNTHLTGGGNYDTTVIFPAPGTTYRKIYMIFTLGKYMCPGYNPANPGTSAGGTGWCGDWDYTLKNYLMIPGGDTLELGRLITPYANALAPRTPWTATQQYVYDVTDYATVLHDTIKMRMAFEAGSGGFTGNVKFAFIEGIPDRNAIAVHRLWDGDFNYGGTPDINTHFPTSFDTAPTGTQSAQLKFTVTGHGSDANGCCEFASHNYQVLLNSVSVANKAIWRTDCGANELYPQSGTWLYQRGNWCPGAIVYSNYHDLPGITAGTPFYVGLKFDPYTGGGYYVTDATLIYHGAMNKTLDAEMEGIIAPTNDGNMFRENPICGTPTVHVKNTGATTIDSITFQYGVQDSIMQTYTWVGILDSLQETDVVMPPLIALNNVAGTSGVHTFIASIAKVNGVADADSTNNTMTSPFVTAPVWPSPFKILLRTNNEAIAPGSSICETSWIIYDMDNNIVRERVNANISALYQDTVDLPSGCYRLQVYDSSCDGLNWWANAAGITSGYIAAYKFPSTVLALSQNGMTGTYSNDFGCGFTQYFYLDSSSAFPLGVNNTIGSSVAIDAYPNPAQGVVNVDISGLQNVRGKIKIIDMLGREVSVTQCNEAHQQINVEQLANGMYTILFIDNANGSRLQTRLLITK